MQKNRHTFSSSSLPARLITDGSHDQCFAIYLQSALEWHLVSFIKAFLKEHCCAQTLGHAVLLFGEGCALKNMDLPQNKCGPELHPFPVSLQRLDHVVNSVLNSKVVVQDLLARRQWLAEQRRPREEESLQHCTGRPAISAFAHSLRRSTDDLIAW